MEKEELHKERKMKNMQSNLKQKGLKEKSKGITLIALVITIIVLLILAGVSIATLTGENGVLKKANEAKDKTNIANVKEMAQTDILGYQAENESEEITIGQLKDVLSKYFKDVPDEEKLKEKLKDTDYSLKVKEDAIKELVKLTNSKLCVCGGDYQSIYNFSGSDINLFLDFPKST